MHDPDSGRPVEHLDLADDTIYMAERGNATAYLYRGQDGGLTAELFHRADDAALTIAIDGQTIAARTSHDTAQILLLTTDRHLHDAVAAVAAALGVPVTRSPDPAFRALPALDGTPTLVGYDLARRRDVATGEPDDNVALLTPHPCDDRAHAVSIGAAHVLDACDPGQIAAWIHAHARCRICPTPCPVRPPLPGHAFTPGRTAHWRTEHGEPETCRTCGQSALLHPTALTT